MVRVLSLWSSLLTHPLDGGPLLNSRAPPVLMVEYLKVLMVEYLKVLNSRACLRILNSRVPKGPLLNSRACLRILMVEPLTDLMVEPAYASSAKLKWQEWEGILKKPLPYGRACLRILRRNIKHLDLNKENGA
jgi:hypothetical protein